MTVPVPDSPPLRPRALNVPPVVLGLLAAMAAIHAVRTLILNDADDSWVLATFAFIPDRDALAFFGLNPPAGAGVWSYVTYAVLHASWMHLILNAVWMAAFGSPLAARFGAARFLLLSAAGAAAGAGAHLIGHGGEVVPMVGASAAVSAHIAGASRFVFTGPAAGYRGIAASFARAASLRTMVTDRRTMTFLVVWFGSNLAAGLLGVGAADGASIAWEAHIGGFVAGLLLFPLLDPVRREGPRG